MHQKFRMSLKSHLMTPFRAKSIFLVILRLLLLLSHFKRVQLCGPHRRQPTRLLCPWASPGKNTGVGCHFLLQCKRVKSESEVAQSCPTLNNPMDCSLPGLSMHGIFQPRVLGWVGIAFSEKTLRTWKESDDQTRQHAKKQRRYFANKDLSSQGYGLSMCHVWM